MAKKNKFKPIAVRIRRISNGRSNDRTVVVCADKNEELEIEFLIRIDSGIKEVRTYKIYVTENANLAWVADLHNQVKESFIIQ